MHFNAKLRWHALIRTVKPTESIGRQVNVLYSSSTRYRPRAWIGVEKALRILPAFSTRFQRELD